MGAMQIFGVQATGRMGRAMLVLVLAMGMMSSTRAAEARASAPPAKAHVYSHNGQIVFDRVSADGEAIITSNPDGAGQHPLGVGGCCADWSPDGSRLALAGPAGWPTPDGRIGTAIVNPDGSGYHVLPIPVAGLNLGCFPWSPNGKRLACSGWDDNDPSRSGVYTVRSSDGGGLVRLAKNPYGGIDDPGDYSPDGSQIVFVRENPNLAEGHNKALFVVDTNGSRSRQITRWGQGGCCTASWSPDGRWILFDAPAPDKHALFVVHPNGDGLHKIPLRTGESWYDAFEPVWSPNGKHIAFSMYLPSLGQDDIFTVRANGTGLVQVTNTPDHEGQVDWGRHQLDR
ncbi:hypothetical protein ACFWUU_07710 [Kribbella sp. NPDC058693]|uniref:TolB family protein n=1 Tax=Kribbella sp. NPDC058693 TaxID=3346602 RepID=UPI00364C6A9D